ncbi:MAG: hypothetical protein IMX02_00140 [Limnochordaceae bacterium]|nr:hypothetical protein [Limnochordaceae bacterium]
MAAFDEGQPSLDALSGDVETFLGETTEEYYQNGAGLKPELQLSPIYERFAHLFDVATVERVRKALQQPNDAERQRRWRYLLDFLVAGYLEGAVKEMVDALVTRETQGVIRFDGEELPFRTVSVRLANEPDRARRDRLYEARQAFVAELNPDREAIWERHRELVRSLGYLTSLAMYQELKRIDFAALGRTMTRFLSRTEQAYRTHFEPALEERAGVGFGVARKHDVAWMLRATAFDPMFPKERLVPALEQTLAGLGIALGSQPNVHLDTEPRPQKSPRAFCAPVRVPADVRLVILPQGGQDDYHALLHEAGHMEHFAHTRADLPAEYRYLGDNSVTECFAFLFEYLTTNPEWLEKVLGASPAQIAAYTAFTRLDRLYFLRRYAAKLLYELELHQSPSLGPMPGRYDSILTEATGIQYGRVDYLADVDAGFYVAEYLRAWALEVMLRERLVSRFGRAWFTRREAGDFLRELWASGQRDTGDELARRLGYAAVDFEPITQELAGSP